MFKKMKLGTKIGIGFGVMLLIATVLGIVAFGDASIATAKKAGGITQIAHVDHSVSSILGIYASSCTVVVGQ